MGKKLQGDPTGRSADRRFLGSILDGNSCNKRIFPDNIIIHDHCSLIFDDLQMHESNLDDGFVDDELELPHKTDQLQHDEPRIYWESQLFLLQGILERCESVGSKLREQIKREIEIARESTNFCSCDLKRLMKGGGCIKCLRRAAVNQLSRNKGISTALCISKWNRTHKTPSGRHEYIEVVVRTQGRRKQIPYLVELGFRDEFRMGRACKEYNKLITELPEIFIGKLEHLNAIIRVLCDAAKISADEQKIHIGPWRKKSYMRMKWSSPTTFKIAY